MVTINIKNKHGQVIKIYDLFVSNETNPKCINDIKGEISLLYDIQIQEEYMSIISSLERLNVMYGGLD